MFDIPIVAKIGYDFRYFELAFVYKQGLSKTYHVSEVTPNKKASPFLRLTGQRPAQYEILGDLIQSKATVVLKIGS